MDWPHALEYAARAGQAVLGADTPAYYRWFHCQRRQLLDGDPQRVVDALQQLALLVYDHARAEEVQLTVEESWSYLHKRLPCSTLLHFASRAIQLPGGLPRVPISYSSNAASKDRGCISAKQTSIPCSRSAPCKPMDAGCKAGRPSSSSGDRRRGAPVPPLP
jgi:hypothetical protein